MLCGGSPPRAPPPTAAFVFDCCMERGYCLLHAPRFSSARARAKPNQEPPLSALSGFRDHEMGLWDTESGAPPSAWAGRLAAK
jgi:hypothetical protein